MNYMIFDNPKDNKSMDFINANQNCSIISKFPQQKLRKIIHMVKYCKKIIKETEKNDVLIFWYDFMGIITWYLCKFFNKKRKIIILNILLKDKKSMKNRIAKFLYRKVLKDEKVIFTVTSKEYGENLNRILNIKRNIIVLRDPCHITKKFDNVCENYVFCGGRNGRDWEFLLKIAEKMSDIKFHIVLPEKKYEKIKEIIPENVIVKCEISLDEFLDEISHCKLIVMPLDTEAPAGLLTYYQAAEYGKMVITSNTYTMREYFSDNRGILCDKNIDFWIEKIYYYSENSTERKLIADSFYNFLIEECSEKYYLKTIEELIYKIKGEVL